MNAEDLKVRSDFAEDNMAINNEIKTTRYTIHDNTDPSFGRIAIALILAEVFIEISPYIFEKIYMQVATVSYEGLLRITSLKLAMATFSKPLFIASLVVALVSIIKKEHRLLAYITLGIVVLLFFLYLLNIVG